eukprot:364455-Chlamydomonas_euryale.AAC.10
MQRPRPSHHQWAADAAAARPPAPQPRRRLRSRRHPRCRHPPASASARLYRCSPAGSPQRGLAQQGAPRRQLAARQAGGPSGTPTTRAPAPSQRTHPRTRATRTACPRLRPRLRAPTPTLSPPPHI